MDEAFSHLDDLSDKETLERLESLFENSLPPLDSPILQDHAASAAASILEGTSSNDLGQLDSQDSEDIFGTSTPSTTSNAPPAIVLPTQPSPIVATTTVSTSQRTSSSTTLQQPQTKTVATVSQPSLVSPPQPQQQSSFILSPQPVMTMATGTILTSSTPTVIQGGIQYTLHPAASVNTTTKVTNVSKANKQQPQILPKPASSSSSTAISIPMSTSANTPRPVVTMATMPAPVTAQAGAPSQQFVLNTGGVIAGASSAPLLLTAGAQTNQPILIQQPGGNPILVMRPTAPTTSAILPIVSSAQGGTILLQPQTAAAPTLVQPQQPQIKINTPQGTMQMQQIQTPTGPKLIAVPVGAGQMGSPQVVQQQAVVTSAAVVTSTPPSVQEDKKDKKAKKKLKAALQLQQNSENKSGLDLGELMKDVGLDDLDGYNNEQNTSSSASEPSGTASSAMTSVQNAIISSAQQANQAIMTAPLTLTTSGGNQIVAQIPQQIVQPAPSNQYQLVQGPDGQFILQSTATPTILAQATIGDGLTQGIGLASGSTPLLAASGSLIGTPTPVTGLSTTNSSVIPTVAAATTTLSSSPNIVQLSPKKTRNPPDPNRTPLYVDDRLPPGWHRKVSQRKSGASAGRYEVFIIGPTGKRFRSKNELKAFFDKTGETVLQPEHFDFTTWGANVINLPKEYANKSKSSGSIAPAPDPTMPKLSPMTAAAAPGPGSSNAAAPPVFKSQLSRETAEADAQISQLLESLQKAPANKLDLSVDSEKMSELFNSLTNEDSSSSPPPTLVKPSINSETKNKNNASMPPMTSGTSGFQASFLNSIATPTSTASDKSKVGNSETLPISGAGTQRRALQNLPQNTKLVRGPNGQYSLQKVQTIELTLEQQNSLRVVQAKIQEIEKQPTKSAKEENELAQLHVKQQQILAAGRPVNTQNVTEQVSLTTATSVVSSLNASSSVSTLQPPVSKSIPVPNVTVTKSTPIRYTHTVGNQVISLPPANGSGTTTTTTTASSVSTTSTTPTHHPVGSAAATAAAITQLTDEQKRIVFEFKQKMALLPPEQQPAFISQHKGALLKQLNFQPTQLQLLRNNQIQLQLGASRPTPSSGPSRTILPAPNAKAPRPLPVGAGTIRQPGDEASSTSQNTPSTTSTGGGTNNNNAKQKNIAWIENQIKKDQHEAVNAKYKLPFKSKDDAIKRLLRYHVFYELDSSPQEMVKAEDKFEEKSGEALDKYRSMLDRYHYLLTQESKRLISSSEEVMLARLWDTEERQLFAREKEEVEAGNMIDVPLLDTEKKQQYSNYVNALRPAPPPPQFKDEPMDVKPNPPLLLPEIENLKKRKRSGSSVSVDSANEDKIGLKFARSESGNWVKSQYENQLNNPLFQDPDDDSDDEFTLKDVDTERAVGTILDAASSNDEDEAVEDDEDVDDVLQGMGNAEDEDVVAAAFGTSADSVQNAINSILDTLPQGDRIETPDINNITGLFDSIDDETATERDPVTEAAVNSIPQF